MNSHVGRINLVFYFLEPGLKLVYQNIASGSYTPLIELVSQSTLCDLREPEKNIYQWWQAMMEKLHVVSGVWIQEKRYMVMTA